MLASPARTPVAMARPVADRPVLLALDGSDLAERAIPVAAEIARRRDTTLLVCRAVSDTTHHEMFGFLLDSGLDERVATEAYLARVASEVRSTWPGVHVETAVPSGPAGAALTSTMQATNAQLTVLTTHGRAASVRMMRGSVTEDVVRTSDGATLVLWPWVLDRMTSPDWSADVLIPPPSPGIGKRILVPLDGSARTARVLPEAYRMAREANGELLLLTVLDLHLYRRAVGASIQHSVFDALDHRAAVVRASGVRARAVTAVLADPAAAIIEVAEREDCDTIAMTTHARGAVGRFIFGSVANHVAARAGRPILFTPPLADPMGHGLATMYPDVPVSVLALAKSIEDRAA